MTRITLAILTVGAFLLSSVAARASGGTIVVLHQRTNAMIYGSKSIHRGIHSDVRAGSDSRSPIGQSATALQLPATAYTPATINTQYSGVVDTTLVDQDWFRTNHSAPYETWGWQTGYYQRADWLPAGYSATDTITFRYLGSFFPNASSAAAAYQDGVTYTQTRTGASSSSCSGSTFSCADMAYHVTSGGVSQLEEYTVLQVGVCLIEASVDATQTAASGETSQIETTLTSIDSAALQAASTVCGASVPPQPSPTPTTTTPVAFTILSVRAETVNSRPDWNLVSPPVTLVKAGTKVRLSVYYHVSSAPQSFAYSERVTVKRNGTTLVRQSYPDKLGTTPVDTYRNSWTYTMATAGSYAITIAITMNDHTQALSTAVTVQAAAPPKPKKTSFTLNSVQLLNNQGQPQSKFQGGAPFYVLVNYTVRHLSSRATSYVAVTFELPGTGKALYPPNQYQITTVNGRQSYRARFFVPVRAGSVLKIVAGLTIGRTTHQKSASLTISG